MNNENCNEHERLSSGIEKFHVEKPEVDKIEVDKITPTGEITWVREQTTTCPPVINDTKTYTGQTFTTQEKIKKALSDETLEEIKKSIATQIMKRPWSIHLPTGDFHAKIDPQTNKVVEVKAEDENGSNKYFAQVLKDIIEKQLESMKTEDWIEVNFEVKKLEENNTNNTEEK